MKIYDKELKKKVYVFGKECLKRDYYWPRPDPGVFTQGVGYKSRGSKVSHEYICGTRAIHGCPDKHC